MSSYWYSQFIFRTTESLLTFIDILDRHTPVYVLDHFGKHCPSHWFSDIFFFPKISKATGCTLSNNGLSFSREKSRQRENLQILIGGWMLVQYKKIILAHTPLRIHTPKEKNLI